MKNRWSQLALGVICMMAISSPQYVWALFTKPLTAALGVSLPAIQVTFSLLVVLQAFLSPFQGFLIERFGTRTLLATGAALTGLSWVLSSYAGNVGELYLAYGVLGGIGTGIIYVGVVGHMVQWFPDRRGLATGLAAAGYGSGAILTTIPISHIIAASNYRHALLEFGIILGVIGILAALGLRKPDEVTGAALRMRVKASTNGVSARDYTPVEMVKTPIFWVLFAMMTMMCTSGLMIISQMGAFTKDFGMGDVLVFGVAALPLALSIDRITNGFTRPFFGWVSDRIGRETTMVIAFSLEGAAMIAWLFTRNDPTVFVLMSGVVFFGWGEIFSLFPATLTDTFGTRHATTNYGVLYIAFGVGSVLGGPVAALLHDATHSWIPVFEAIIAMNFLTALLAQFVLRPARRRWLVHSAAAHDTAGVYPAPVLAKA
ncbi:MAG: putative transporter of the major facilitator superfamily [Candidatus Eremiobacteraeota bacterium]|jgi:oxalate/formate antiporter|nr:putative transporter of the major facilitator superfamily [Candidatus Eremiobacteraeota bacterium]